MTRKFGGLPVYEYDRARFDGIAVMSDGADRKAEIAGIILNNGSDITGCIRFDVRVALGLEILSVGKGGFERSLKSAPGIGGRNPGGKGGHREGQIGGIPGTIGYLDQHIHRVILIVRLLGQGKGKRDQRIVGIVRNVVRTYAVQHKVRGVSIVIFGATD